MTSTTIEAQVEKLMQIVPTWRTVDTTKAGYIKQNVETLIRLAGYVEAEKLKGQISELHNLRIPTQTLRDQVDERLESLQQQLDSIEKPESK